MSLPSQAQTDAVDDDEAEQVLEEVIVTGSRIKRRDFESSSPLVTVDRDLLELSSQPTLEEFLNKLPQLTPDFSRAANNPGDGTARLNLRGLGPDRTLVLLNGRRLAPSGVASAVDVNNLPQSLVERVEIITGGASTVYGSDAIAGVVNFITRDDFVGLGIDTSFSITEEGDAEAFDFNATYGFELGDTGNLTLFASYYDREPLFASEREFTSVALADRFGVLFPRTSSATPSGVIFAGIDFGDDGFGRATFNADGSPRLYDQPVDGYNFAPVNYLQTPLERISLGLFGTLPLTDDLEAYVEASYVDNQSGRELASVPLQIFALVNTDNPILHPDTRTLFEQQLLVAPGLAAFPIARRLTDLGGRISNFDREYTRLVAGLRGELWAGWDLDAWVTYTDVDEKEQALNSASRSRFLQGLLVDPATGSCFDPSGGCVPVDIFGPNSLSQAAIDFVALPPLINTASRQQTLASVVLSGELFSTWAGPVATAFGLEWRRDEADFKADDFLFTNDALGLTPSSPISGTESVWEIYGEAILPLIDAADSGHYLGLELGGRYSDYDNAGSVDTWKFGIDWRPTASLRFRAMAQRSVRAPNIAELFTEQTSQFAIGLVPFEVDPCSAESDPAGSGVADKCVIQGLDPAQIGVFVADDQYPGTFVTGGNPNLAPEEADTLTAGVVITPLAQDNLTIAIDWYDLDMEGTIGTIDPFLICFDPNNSENLFCERIQRDGTGNVARVESLIENRGVLSTSGIDTQVQYRTDLPDWAGLMDNYADLSVTAIWTHVLSWETQENPVTEIYECAGYFGFPCGSSSAPSTPENRLYTNFRYSSGAFGTQLSWRWIDGMDNAWDYIEPDWGPVISEVSDVSYFDLGFSWQPSETVNLRLAVNNLFDQDAPNMAWWVNSNNTDSSLYDVYGRSYILSLAWNPGF